MHGKPPAKNAKTAAVAAHHRARGLAALTQAPRARRHWTDLCRSSTESDVAVDGAAGGGQVAGMAGAGEAAEGEAAEGEDATTVNQEASKPVDNVPGGSSTDRHEEQEHNTGETLPVRGGGPAAAVSEAESIAKVLLGIIEARTADGEDEDNCSEA